MAFHIGVYRESDWPVITSPPPDVYSDEYARWEEDANSRILYANPLGSDGTVYQYWSMPAQILNLPLIASIYDNGLTVSVYQLDMFLNELHHLEIYWSTLPLSQKEDLTVTVYEKDKVIEYMQSFAEHLSERMGYLHEAIAIAREKNGIISIG